MLIHLYILYRYHDGAIATELDSPNIKMVKMFYPKWWLNITGYFGNPPNFGPGVLMFQPSPSNSMNMNSSGYNSIYIIFIALTTLIIGIYVGRHYFPKPLSNREYMAMEIV